MGLNVKRALKLALLFAGIATVAYADTKISQMPNAGPLGGNELIPAVQNGINVTTSPSQIKLFAGTGTGAGSVTNVSAGCGLTGGPIISTGTLAAAEFRNTQSGTSYTLITGDCGKLLTQSNAAASTWTLLAPATAGAGYFFDAVNLGAGLLTLAPASGTINGAATLAVSSGQGVHVVSDGTTYIANVGTSASGATIASLFGNQAKNLVFTGPPSGANTTPAFRALVGADLPNPSATTLGGVESFAAVTNNFLTGVTTSGIHTSAQPNCGNLSDFGTACRATTGTSGHALGFLDGGNAYTGKQTFNGGVNASRRTVAANATATATDYEICVDVSAGTLTLTTPANPANGDKLLVTDCKRKAGTNVLTIAANTGQTIFGAATLGMNANGASVGLTWNSTDSDWNTH